MEIRNLTISTPKGKTIINDITLSLKRGEILAIMGPSGSGKTTLLDFFTKNIRSNLDYDGQLETRGFVKYVAQEDFLHGFYTVRQYLNHYITLNYGNIPKKTRNSIITEIAESTGLTSALDTRVGDVFYKGLSGGQKRRLSIALELVSKPDILILDEPTSGLDSVSAYHIVEVLKKLTQENICVVCTLHQPSSQIWMMLDKVLLLANGYMCYYGEPLRTQDFFDSLGKPLPPHYNPADFYILQINSDFDKSINAKDLNQNFLKWNEQNLTIRNQASNQEIEMVPPVIPKLTRRASSLQEIVSQVHTKASGTRKLIALCQRGFYNLIMNPGIIGVRLAMYLMLSFVLGFMYFDLGSEFGHNDIISRISLLFYVNAFLVFMSIAALPFFMSERLIVQKEIRNKLYKPLQYQISQFLTSLPGVGVIAVTSSLLVALIPNLNGFGFFLLTLFLALVVAEALAVLISLIVPHYVIGMAVIAGLYGVFMLVCGFLIVKDDIPGYFIWLYYIAFHTYAFEAFMYNEFRNIESFDSQQFPTGQAVLEFYDMEDVDLWKDFIILAGYAFILELFIYFTMLYRFRERKIKHRKHAVTPVPTQVAVN